MWQVTSMSTLNEGDSVHSISDLTLSQELLGSKSDGQSLANRASLRDLGPCTTEVLVFTHAKQR